MSGVKEIFVGGEKAVVATVNRVAVTAASADDAVYGTLGAFTAGATQDKVVTPLDQAGQSTGYETRNLLALPDPADATRLLVKAAQYARSTKSGFPRRASVAQAAPKDAESLAPTSFPSGFTLPRIDLVYAALSVAPTTAARVVKDPTTGAVGVQTINQLVTPTVALGTVQGAENVVPVAPALPADTSDTFYFPVATVDLDDGAGGPWAAGSALTDRVHQEWTGGWPIEPTRIQTLAPATICATSWANANGVGPTRLTGRICAKIGVMCTLYHHSAASGTIVTVDSAHDWSNRLVWLTFVATVDTGFTGTNAHAPEDSGCLGSRAPFFYQTFTGTKDAGHVIAVYDPGGGGTTRVNVTLDSAGALGVEFHEAPFITNAQYLMVAEATDRFVTDAM